MDGAEATAGAVVAAGLPPRLRMALALRAAALCLLPALSWPAPAAAQQQQRPLETAVYDAWVFFRLIDHNGRPGCALVTPPRSAAGQGIALAVSTENGNVAARFTERRLPAQAVVPALGFELDGTRWGVRDHRIEEDGAVFFHLGADSRRFLRALASAGRAELFLAGLPPRPLDTRGAHAAVGRFSDCYDALHPGRGG